MPTPPGMVSCSDLAKAYWAAVAAHGENSSEAQMALLQWQIQCDKPGDNSGGAGQHLPPPG